MKQPIPSANNHFDDYIRQQLDAVEIDPVLAEQYWQDMPIMNKPPNSWYKLAAWWGGLLLLVVTAFFLVKPYMNFSTVKQNTTNTPRLLPHPQQPISPVPTTTTTTNQQIVNPDHVLELSDSHKVTKSSKSNLAKVTVISQRTGTDSKSVIISVLKSSQIPDMDTAVTPAIPTSANKVVAPSAAIDLKDTARKKAPHIIW